MEIRYQHIFFVVHAWEWLNAQVGVFVIMLLHVLPTFLCAVRIMQPSFIYTSYIYTNPSVPGSLFKRRDYMDQGIYFIGIHKFQITVPITVQALLLLLALVMFTCSMCMKQKKNNSITLFCIRSTWVLFVLSPLTRHLSLLLPLLSSHPPPPTHTHTHILLHSPFIESKLTLYISGTVS